MKLRYTADFLSGLFLSALLPMMLSCAPTEATRNISPRLPASPPNSNAGGFKAQVGVISGSQQSQTTTLGYKSFGSIGEPHAGILQTTPLGYKALISVQGHVVQ